MSEFDELKSSIGQATEYTFGQIRALSASAGISSSEISSAIEELRSKYETVGLKPKVVPSALKKSSAPKKSATTYHWVIHPTNPEFSYTEDFRLSTGYPLKENETGYIIATIDEEVQQLTPKDVAAISTRGMKAQVRKI